jgi:hypothetical protein
LVLTATCRHIPEDQSPHVELVFIKNTNRQVENQAFIMKNAVFWDITLCYVALVRTDVSEELGASIIRVTICELETTLVVTSASVASYGVCSYFTDSCHPDDGGVTFLDTSVLTRATWRNMPDDGILHSHCCEDPNLTKHLSWLFYLYTYMHMCAHLCVQNTIERSACAV